MNKLGKKLLCLCMTGMIAFTAPAATAVSSAVPVYAEVSVGNFTDEDFNIFINMIGACESGGLVYGQRDYATYLSLADSWGAEQTITIGWWSAYGNNGRALLNRIYHADPTLFQSIDTDGSIQSMLGKDWETLGWEPKAAQKDVIVRLITTDTGKKCQDEAFKEFAKSYIENCQSMYTNDVAACMMYGEIGMLGGEAAAKRIFNRVEDDYSSNFSLDNIMAALSDDQKASTNPYSVSGAIYNTRHRLFYEWINTYLQPTDPQANGVFTDVQNTSAYYFEPVYWAYQNQVTSGTSSTTFSPSNTTTRAEIITWMYRLLGNGEVSASAGFTDVSPSSYYYQAVNWAGQHGISAGLGDGSFGAAVNCTRAQIITMLYRCYAGGTGSYTSSFRDVSASAYYYNAVGWAVQNGITSGISASTFSPEASCSRAEAVPFLYRAASRF